ncbi:unnamed protein product, partial [Plutella xylostella]
LRPRPTFHLPNRRGASHQGMGPGTARHVCRREA